MKKLKIFLTGGSGFIGKNILEGLGGKYRFVTNTHRRLDLLNSKEVDKLFAKNKFFDVVIHSAYLGGLRNSIDTPQVLNDNLRMFFNIEKNRQYFGKLITLGSGAEYGKQRPLSRIREVDFGNVIPLGTDYYGFSKYIIAKYVEGSNKIVNMRLFGVFGAYEDQTLRFISNAICRSILGMPITIRKNVYFEYLYISDFVRILDYFINHNLKFKSYNIGSGQPIDLITIAKKVNAIAPQVSPIKIKSKGLAFEYSCSSKRLIKELGNLKFTKMDDAILKLYKFYDQRKALLIKRDLLL